MPIRFRCKFCNQLMGIARRKVGTEVECPTCKGKLLVPQTSSEAAPSPSPAPAKAPPPEMPPPPLFERSDFGDFLSPAAQPEPVLAGAQQAAAPRPQAPPAPRPLRLPSSYDVDMEPMPGALAPVRTAPAGIVLTPGRATLLTVAIILGLAVAFSLGLVVGKML